MFMKILPLLSLCFLITLPAVADKSRIDLKVTHGPILGRPGATTMSIWVSTNVPGEVAVNYGTERLKQLMMSEYVETKLEDDNTAIITLTNLYPDTLYYYTVDKGLGGTFKTLPSTEDFIDEAQSKGAFQFPVRIRFLR